jgi:hypothetical protein
MSLPKRDPLLDSRAMFFNPPTGNLSALSGSLIWERLRISVFKLRCRFPLHNVIWGKSEGACNVTARRRSINATLCIA